MHVYVLHHTEGDTQVFGSKSGIIEYLTRWKETNPVPFLYLDEEYEEQIHFQSLAFVLRVPNTVYIYETAAHGYWTYKITTS